MRGMHNEKVFAFCTDERGGDNAKSTFTGAILSALGDYATQEDPDFFYKRDSARDTNGHSENTIRMRKKNLVTMEEADKSKVFDGPKLKKLCGGGAKQTARALYGKSTEFDWITSFIMNFNENNLPSIDTSDQASLNRYLFFPFTSKFYVNPVDYELHKNEPHTYLADTDLMTRNGEAFKPLMFKWLLEGLKAYYDEGFRNIPPSMLKFKEKVIADKNVVRKFLLETIEKESPEEHAKRQQSDNPSDEPVVKRADLFKMFNNTHRDVQQDKKTKIGLEDFGRSMKELAGNACYVEKHRTTGRHYITGWQMTADYV